MTLEEYFNNNYRPPHTCSQESRLIAIEHKIETKSQEVSEIKMLYQSLEKKLDDGFALINAKIMVGLGFIISILLTALGFLIYYIITQ